MSQSTNQSTALAGFGFPLTEDFYVLSIKLAAAVGVKLIKRGEGQPKVRL